jgi:hypothetical protein
MELGTNKRQLVSFDWAIKKVYSINIVYFDLGQGKDYVYHGKTSFRGLHNQDTLKLSEKQRELTGKTEAGDLYPEYYILKINNFDDMAKNTLDEWIYFLKNDRIEQNFSAKGLIEARNVLDYNRLSPDEKKDFDYAESEKEEYLCHIVSARDEGAMKAKIEFAKAFEEQRKALEEKDKTLEKLLQEIAELKQSLNINQENQ